MCAARANGFLFSKVFALCRSEDRIQAYSTNNRSVVVLGRSFGERQAAKTVHLRIVEQFVPTSFPPCLAHVLACLWRIGTACGWRIVISPIVRTENFIHGFSV